MPKSLAAIACRQCGKPFTPTRAWQSFDTTACRTGWHRDQDEAAQARTIQAYQDEIAALKRQLALLQQGRT